MSEIMRQGGIIENYLVREGLIDQLTKPVTSLSNKEEEYIYRGGEQRVKFKTLVLKNVIYFLFLNQTRSGFLELGKGNYYIKRNKSSGRFESIQIPFRDDDACYLEIMPEGRQTIMNIYLFQEKPIYHSIRLPLSLESLITAPFARIIEATLGTVDWEKLLFRGGRDEDRQIASIRKRIESVQTRITEAADGALNEKGEFVAIADGRPLTSKKGLNCSGFMKWLVDGFYYPLTGRLTPIEALKERHFDRRGNRWNRRDEETRDPYFGLDWTRNLAALLARAQAGDASAGAGAIHPEAFDVRHSPFLEYTEDSGYRVSDLLVLLYFLAVEEPGTIFLGSVNDIHVKNALLVQNFHVAAFLPYFDENGRFQVAVMDQHKNPDIRAFMEKYQSRYIHLVRVRIGSDFSPIHIE